MGEHPSGTSVTHATAEGIPAAPWRTWSAGTRVVVRRRVAGGGFADVLGDLVAVSEDGVVVRTRRGEVRVAAADIALGKPVPPAPARRGRRDAASAPAGTDPG